MVNLTNIKGAPLYQVVAKVTATNDISIRVFALSRAKMKDDTWIYPADTGNKHVPSKNLNKIDEVEFAEKSVLRGYCVSKNYIKVLVCDMEDKLNKTITITTPVATVVKNTKRPVVVEKVTHSVKEEENVVERKFYGANLEDYNAVKEILAGNKNAFAVIYKRYEPIINQTYKRNLKFDKELADDLTMELFEKVYEKIAEYKPTYTFSSWITKISKNFFIDYTRGFNYRKSLQNVSMDRGITTEEGEQLMNSNGDGLTFTLQDKNAFTGEEILTTAERNTALNKAFLKLNQKDRDIITGYYINDKSYEEMAKEMSMPLGTVKAYMFRAKARLREYLEENKGLLACVQN